MVREHFNAETAIGAEDHMIDNLRLEEGKSLLTDWIARNQHELKQRNAALKKWGQYFRSGHLMQITQSGVREFLMLRNNKHWGSLQRHSEIYADIKRLRRCLATLLDESQPIDVRLDKLIASDASPFINGLGPSVLTAILRCVYPDSYAVYNSKSVGALTWLGLFHEDRGLSRGSNYLALNRANKKLSKHTGLSLDLVDLMIGLLKKKIEATKAITKKNPDLTYTPEFSGRRAIYERTGIVASVCTHGDVVGALRSELLKKIGAGKNSKKLDLFLTDGYVLDGHANMTHLFEVKTRLTTTDLYAAVGQLMLHGAVQNAPQRIVVLPGKVATDTRKRLDRLGIKVLRYTLSGKKPVFRELESVIPCPDIMPTHRFTRLLGTKG